MCHISVNLAISRRIKNLWGTKSSRGGKRLKRGGGGQKKCKLFLDTQVVVGAPKKSAGASNGNVTPLG